MAEPKRIRKRIAALLLPLLALVLAGAGLLSVIRAQDGPAETEGRQRPLRKGLVVFVVDASASMRIRDVPGDGGTTRTRLEAAVQEIEKTLDGLLEDAEFTFDIVLCSSRVGILSEALAEAGPLRLTPRTREEASRFLREVPRAGMSRLLSALDTALRICRRGGSRRRPASVCLYSDGIPTFDRRSPGPRTIDGFLETVEASNRSGERINAFAVSATSEGLEFLARLCRENRGLLFTL